MARQSTQTRYSGMRTWRLDRGDDKSPESSQRRQKKGFQACSYCKTKKVRCNGESPCTQCLDRGKQCTRSVRLKRHTAAVDGSNDQPAQSRTDASVTETSPLASGSAKDHGNCDEFQDQGEQEFSTAIISANTSPQDTQNNVDLAYMPAFSLPNWKAEVSARDDQTRETTRASSPYGDIQDDGSVSPSAEYSNSEYHGPWSFLSICSKPAIAWVTAKAQIPDFKLVADTLNGNVTGRLKLDGNRSYTCSPEPEPELAWECVNAYFAEAQETAFGVVNRTWFEARLKAHFIVPEPAEDAAWYALRNVIFAYGYRFTHSGKLNYGKTRDTSWSWFENALSVNSQLIFNRTSLVGVQALIVMAYYTEGVCVPILQYMLTATALHLAYSKGLHRRPAPSWKMTREMIDHRSRIFWAIYCMEKTQASRSGRPSAIHDDEITCWAPSFTSTDDCMNSTYCTLLVQISQTSSLVLRRLNSAQVVRESPEQILRMIIELDGQVQFMKTSMESMIDLDALIVPGKLLPSLSISQALDLQFAYFGIIFNLHSSLANPWSISALRSKGDPKLQEELRKCSLIAATAAKTAIMSTSFVRLDETSSIAHTYYIPIYAIIALFVHTIQYMDEREMKTDLVLFDLAVGHFARMQLLTGAPMHFARDLAQFVHRTEVNKALKNASGDKQIVSAGFSITQDGTDVNRTETSGAANSTQGADEDFQGSLNTLWDVDMWSTWLDDLGDVI